MRECTAHVYDLRRSRRCETQASPSAPSADMYDGLPGSSVARIPSAGLRAGDAKTSGGSGERSRRC